MQIWGNAVKTHGYIKNDKYIDSTNNSKKFDDTEFITVYANCDRLAMSIDKNMAQNCHFQTRIQFKTT